MPTCCRGGGRAWAQLLPSRGPRRSRAACAGHTRAAAGVDSVDMVDMCRYCRISGYLLIQRFEPLPGGLHLLLEGGGLVRVHLHLARVTKTDEILLMTSEMYRGQDCIHMEIKCFEIF